MTQVEAVLLAAGASTRMGRPKALLPWSGSTLIESQIRCLDEAGISGIIVILGHNASYIASVVQETDRLKVFINPDYNRGKTTSIKLGLKEIHVGTEVVMLLAVDQPRPVPLLKRLLDEHYKVRPLITQPKYRSQGGHPLLFDSSLLPELLEITEEEQGIREVMNRHRNQINHVSVDSPIVLLDLNTEEEYKKALQYPSINSWF